MPMTAAINPPVERWLLELGVVVDEDEAEPLEVIELESESEFEPDELGMEVIVALDPEPGALILPPIVALALMRDPDPEPEAGPEPAPPVAR